MGNERRDCFSNLDFGLWSTKTQNFMGNHYHLLLKDESSKSFKGNEIVWRYIHHAFQDGATFLPYELKRYSLIKYGFKNDVKA